MTIEKKFELTANESALLRQINTPAEVSGKADEILIEYRPHAALQKWIQYRFSAWSTFKAWFAMSLVVAFFGFGGPGFVLQAIMNLTTGASGAAAQAGFAVGTAAADKYLVLEILFGLFSLAVAGGAAVYAATPTHLRLNYSGVQLEWHRFRLNYKRFLPWEQMERIEMFYPEGKTAQQDSVLKFKSINDSLSLTLKLGAISTIQERGKLQEGIDKWAGNLSRDPHLLEVLKPAVDHSYTELWMQALSAPPKRERLTPLAPNSQLHEGRFTIIDQLGVGGQGTAYLTHNSSDNSEVVLKEFILPVYVDVNVRRQALERMQNEAAMLRRLDNPRIVRLLDFFIEDHRGYLVLERIDGYSLRKIVDDEGKMSEQRVRELALQMCEMLKYLHSLTPPVVHRDFTPDNLIWGSDGILKLVDFNVAQQTESTATGTVVGKHCYLPPEQFRGKPCTQSDIYAMGATLYYLLIGEDPEPITSSNPSLKCPEISSELNAIIARATALDIAKRCANAEEIEAALSESSAKQITAT
jgi:tRNA A-37 threonylcarbamoyl transferase component Bud32